MADQSTTHHPPEPGIRIRVAAGPQHHAMPAADWSVQAVAIRRSLAGQPGAQGLTVLEFARRAGLAGSASQVPGRRRPAEDGPPEAALIRDAARAHAVGHLRAGELLGDPVLDAVAGRALDMAGVTAAVIVLRHGATCVPVSFREACGRAGIRRTLPPGDQLCCGPLRRGGPVVVASPAAGGDGGPEATLPVGAGVGAAVPIHVDAAVAGVLGVLSDAPRWWGLRDIRRLTLLAREASRRLA